FFNNGSSTGPGDQNGDVFAQMRMTRDSTAGAEFRLVVFQCGDHDCTTPNITTIGAHKFTATWALNESHSLVLAWDPASNQFTGLVNLGPSQELFSVSYGA